MLKKTLKIALGDLRHETVGRHSAYLPIGIAYIASYTLSKFEPGSINVRLYTNPNEIIKEIDDWKPDIIGLANYCWNSSLSNLVCKFAKKKIPGVLCVMGGPEFPRRDEERRNYLTERPEVDFYVYGDGESAFASLVGEFYKTELDVNRLKSKPIDGTICINSKTGDMLVGPLMARFKNMDVIPSPYLSGLLDDFLIKNYIPSIETARGCPFKCAYCHTGRHEIKRISTFSVQRIKDEVSYIAKRRTKSSNRTLAIYDSNWGMHKRDVEIIEHIALLIDNYDWPKSIETSTGKGPHDLSLFIVERLKNRVAIGLSQQSLNPKTLKAIQRTNLARKQYSELVNELKRRGQAPACELIIPMPEETKGSYIEGQKFLIEAGINSATYTLMMLKGTPFELKEFRNKYQMKTKYRILPRQFGEYFGEKCFEIEEVCIETNTMPFEDYIECRGFSYLAELFTLIDFDIIRRHLNELGLSFYEYVHEVWKIVKSKNVFLSEKYARFVKEAREELFDSKPAIYGYFSKSENYEKLIKSEKGDNLLRKYVTEVFLLDASKLFDFAYSFLKQFAGDKITPEVSESLNAAKQWASSVITVNSVFNDKSTLDFVKILNLPYDVLSWYKIPNNPNPLVTYNTPVKYKIFYDNEYIYSILDECRDLFGQDETFQLGKFLSTRKINDLWRTCTKI